MPAIPTLTTAALLSLLGVNTHLNWATKAWEPAAWPTIEADVAYLGVGYLRDAVPMADSTLPEYIRLARRGVRFDLISSPDFAREIPAGIDALARAVPGSVAAVEGINEINLFPQDFAGLHSMQQPGAFAHAIQPALYAAVHADPVLAGVPVYNLTIGLDTPALITSLGDMTGVADVANWHPYAGRFGPSTNLRLGAAKATGIVRGKPLVFTEGGYCGAIEGAWCSVTRAQQAAWTLDMFLDSARLGARLYVYELADNDRRSSPGDAENGFGMFDFTGRPNPVAVALHTLGRILADPIAPGRVTPIAPGRVTPIAPGRVTSVEATITGDVQALALAKSDGSAQLILWNEGGATPVTVTLPVPHALLSISDPLVGEQPVTTMADTATARMTVTDHPLVLTISADR